MQDIIKEIDYNQLKTNAKIIKLMLPVQTKFCAVVKSDAYGHGIKLCKAIDKYVDYFGVINNQEALTLRKLTKKPILVMGAFNNNLLTAAIKNRIEQSISHPNDLNSIIKVAQKLQTQAKIHIQIDTGMHRLGIDKNEELNSLLSVAKSNKFIKVKTIYSQLSDKLPMQIENQLKNFNYITKNIKTCRHLFNSAFYLAPIKLDMVRVGIGLYGYNFPYVSPILTIKARILEIRNVKSGETIGYGSKHRLTKDCLIAVVAIGYNEGLPYNWGKLGYVLYKDKKCPFVADICMNMSIIKATPEMKINDYVTILGKSHKKGILASEIAKKSNTIINEILSNFKHISC